jgi:transformation/transcription domain-associated protein
VCCVSCAVCYAVRCQQLYPKFVDPNITVLIPLMMKALATGQLLAGNPEVKKRPALFADFIAAQVKTLSFLTYVLRGCGEKMQPYQQDLANAVLHLLTYCPPDAVSSRKELLVATRHILATDFRKGFYKKIDYLLEEKTLIGTANTQFEVLRYV